MGKKKITMYSIIIFIILLVVGIGYLVYINVNCEDEIKEEYIPEMEISDEQLRKTVINLFFLNKNNNKVESEKREIDSKYLLENPYNILISLLIQGPENEELEKIIPEEINIKNIEIKNGIVYIEFSEDYNNIENKELIIESIEKTLKQLNEVEEIKIINK